MNIIENGRQIEAKPTSKPDNVFETMVKSAERSVIINAFRLLGMGTALLPGAALADTGASPTADGGTIIPVSVAGEMPNCSLKLGFAAAADLGPAEGAVLVCTDEEGHNAENGDGIQHAVSVADPNKPIQVELVWRKGDNWTAFTDGYHTWVHGPNGLQERLNTQRFSWEANPEGLSVIDQPLTPDNPISPAQADADIAAYKKAHPQTVAITGVVGSDGGTAQLPPMEVPGITIDKNFLLQNCKVSNPPEHWFSEQPVIGGRVTAGAEVGVIVSGDQKSVDVQIETSQDGASSGVVDIEITPSNTQPFLVYAPAASNGTYSSREIYRLNNASDTAKIIDAAVGANNGIIIKQNDNGTDQLSLPASCPTSPSS